MRKRYELFVMCVAGVLWLTGCGSGPSVRPPSEGVVTETPATKSGEAEAEAGKAEQPAVGESEQPACDDALITIAVPPALEACIKERLIPLFEEQYLGIKIGGIYDSSEHLLEQIRGGADVDVFFPAAGQMEALKAEGLVNEGSIVNLWEDRLVFLVPESGEGEYESFEDVVKPDRVALVDPESAAAGRRSEEVLRELGLWDQVNKKAVLEENAAGVLNQVAEGAAGGGLVYAADAAGIDGVSVVAQAPSDRGEKPVYAVGILKSTQEEDAAGRFVDFLQSEEAIKVFETYGYRVEGRQR